MNTFYTRRGDDGTTGVLGPGRVQKFDLRPETLGTIDEANAALGLARSCSKGPEMSGLILQIQRDLYEVMGEVAATSPETAEKFRTIDEHKVDWLEQQIALLSAQVEVPKEFIVPGDTLQGAAFDMARTIVRRAERRAAELLSRGEMFNPLLLQYLNRLSSLLFVVELYETQHAGIDQPTFARTDES